MVKKYTCSYTSVMYRKVKHLAGKKIHVLTEAVVARLGVIIVTILADLVKVFQVRVSVELGHFLYCSQLRFNNAEVGEGIN